MARKNKNNQYVHSNMDQVLQGFCFTPTPDYVDHLPPVAPAPTPPAKPLVVTVKCAWRHSDCHDIVLDGRDLCQAHLTEVKARAKTLKAKRSAL